MKHTKHKLLSSIATLFVCLAMFIGSTYAWFTDSASTGVNKIQAGNLDIEVDYSKDGNVWTSIEGTESLFSSDLWEPGHTEYVYLKVKNAGTLAFKYKILVSPVSEKSGISVVNDTPFKLSSYLKFGTTNPNETNTIYSDRASVRNAVSSSIGLNQNDLTQTGEILPNGADQYLTLVVYMPENVENDANYKKGTEAPYINLGITVVATQLSHEEDSFSNDYDASTDLSQIPQYGVVESETIEAVIDGNDIVFNSNVTPAQQDNLTSKITIPAGTDGFDNGNTAILKVEAIPIITASNMFNVNSDNGSVGAIDLTATVSDGTDVRTVSQFKDSSGSPVTVKVETYIAKNLTNLTLNYGAEQWTQVSNEDNVNTGHFYYDADTGRLVFGTTHFSTFVVGAAESVYVKSNNSAYKTNHEAFTAAIANDVITLLKNTETTENNSRIGVSVLLDLNKKVFRLNSDITFGENTSYVVSPVAVTIMNGNIISACDNVADEYSIGFAGGSSGKFSEVTFKSDKTSRSTEMFKVYANSNTESATPNKYVFDNCVFDNSMLSFSGASGGSYEFVTGFDNCKFVNMKFISGYGDSVITFDSYTYGTANFSDCYFDITSVRNGSSAATAIRSDVLQSYVGDNKLNISLNNVFIEGTTENSNSTFYPLTIVNENKANCSTIVTKTGTNTFTRNGAKATMTANTPVYSVSYLYSNNTTPKTEKWSSVNGKLSNYINSHSYYNVVITLLEDSEENMTLSGQKLVVPNGFTYTGTVTAATGYTLIEETNEDGTKTYASVQAEFNGKKSTLIEAQKAMQETGLGTIKLLADGVSFSGSYKLGPNMTINLNGHNAKNKPTPVANYAVKLEGDIYSVVEAIAKANNTNFASLADAAAAVTIHNPSITLLRDCSEDLELPVNITNRVKLDTNGKNYTGNVSVPEGYQLMHVRNIYAIAVAKVTIGDNEPAYYIYDNTPGATTTGTAAYSIANAEADCQMDILVDYNHTTVNGLWLIAPAGHQLIVNTNGHTVAGGVNANSGNTRTDNGNGSYTITRK